MINKLWNKYKNVLVKVFCYIVTVSILLVGLDLNFHNLFKTESSLVKAQVDEEVMEVVTNDSYEIIGSVERVKAEMFGIYSSEEYPSSLHTLIDIDRSKRENIYNENIDMYEDIELAISENRLKKHVSADGQFWGVVRDDAPGIVKKTYVNASVKRKHSLGVYAPAGEVLTVEIDESLINKGLSVVVGYENDANNIPLEKFLDGNKDRMPLISKSFNLTSTITKIGTPLGGVVYVHVPDTVNENFEITVSGGVDNPVFQLGVNNEKDYQEMLKTPGLVMEFKLPHVRLIMPKSYAISDNIIDALEMWHKMSSLSTYAMNRVGNTLPIAHYYDSYVPAGAAVAYQWGWFSILPLSWGTSALNYENMMESGNWGNFHEFNHHYQSMNYNSGQWGLNNPGEVTNNVLTTMSYILYTDIAATRSENIAPGNGGWNNSADPYYNLSNVLNVSNIVASFDEFGTNQLYIYADLMHAFGTKKFMKLIRSSYGLELGYEKNLLNDVDSFALRASRIFESDLTYYLVNICKMNLQEETITTIKNMNFDPYLPLYNLYSNGIKGLNTGRPYYLNKQNYIFDFNKYTVSPLDYEIKEISKMKYGRLNKKDDGTYSYSNRYLKKDSFSITYSINYEGKEYLKTLDFEIDFSYDKASLRTYNTDASDINEALESLKKENLISESYINSINYNVPEGVNLSISEGKLKVEKSGNYIFAIYGDDQIRFKINGYEANTVSYSNGINVDDEKTLFSIYLNAGEFYDYTLYCLNLGGTGNARVVYSYENENKFISITDDYVFNKSATKENSEKRINSYEIIYESANDMIANKYSSSTINKIESITTNANSNGGTLVENMFDGNKSTPFHTAWQSDITKFPHEYIIKFKERALFDSINIYFTSNNTYYAIGQYEIYISDNNKKYTLIKDDSNTNNILNIGFDKLQKAKYIKLVVKSNLSNQLFTSISEIEVGIKSDINNLSYYAANNNKLHYIDTWSLNYTGNHFNGVKGMAEEGSKVEFYFVGDEIAIYTGLNSRYRIKIDNNDWVNITTKSDETSPSYVKNNLENKKHKVVIEALNDKMSLEMIGVNGRIEDRNIYSLSFIEIYKIIASFAITIVLVQGALYLYEKKFFFDFIKNKFRAIKEKLIKR